MLGAALLCLCLAFPSQRHGQWRAVCFQALRATAGASQRRAWRRGTAERALSGPPADPAGLSHGLSHSRIRAPSWGCVRGQVHAFSLIKNRAYGGFIPDYFTTNFDGMEKADKERHFSLHQTQEYKNIFNMFGHFLEEEELLNKNPTRPFLWQAPASAQKTKKRETRPAIRRSARWRVSVWRSLTLEPLRSLTHRKRAQ